MGTGLRPYGGRHLWERRRVHARAVAHAAHAFKRAGCGLAESWQNFSTSTDQYGKCAPRLYLFLRGKGSLLGSMRRTANQL